MPVPNDFSHYRADYKNTKDYKTYQFKRMSGNSLYSFNTARNALDISTYFE